LKKIIRLSICLLLLVACFTGCMETREYSLYRSFAKSYKVGMDKQKALNRIGCPDVYIDVDGNHYRYRYDNKESFAEDVLCESAVIWIYDCYQYRDPANPCRLKLSFDSKGKCKDVDFSFVAGG